MRTVHTGIFERTILETPEEWFRGGGLLGSVNSVVAVAECAKRARETFRKLFNLPKAPSTKNGNVIVRLDSSRRPLTDIQDRDENLSVLENLSRRDLRNNPVLADVRALVFTAEVFRLTLQEREALVRKKDELRPVEFLRALTLLEENLRCRAMRIVELDKQIAVAPYEDKVQYGQKRLRDASRMRRGKKKKGDVKKTVWKVRMRRLIKRHPKWTNHAIAKEARENPPKLLKPAALSTLISWLDEIRTPATR
jgi:hypothetical protein